LTKTEAFIIYKEKRLIAAMDELRNFDRTAEVKPKLILGKSSARRAVRIAEKIVRIQVAIPKKFPRLAVQIVASGLGGEINNTAGETAILRRKIIGGDFKLLQRILGRN
jgi:hypothetical protein